MDAIDEGLKLITALQVRGIFVVSPCFYLFFLSGCFILEFLVAHHLLLVKMSTICCESLEFDWKLKFSKMFGVTWEVISCIYILLFLECLRCEFHINAILQCQPYLKYRVELLSINSLFTFCYHCMCAIYATVSFATLPLRWLGGCTISSYSYCFIWRCLTKQLFLPAGSICLVVI